MTTVVAVTESAWDPHGNQTGSLQARSTQSDVLEPTVTADTRPTVDPSCLCGRPHPCPAHGPHIGPARHPWPTPRPSRADPFNDRLIEMARSGLLAQAMAEAESDHYPTTSRRHGTH